MQTKGAIGNLINRYRAVLKKCNLLNTFGTLAIASALAMGGAGLAGAATFSGDYEITITGTNEDPVVDEGKFEGVSGATVGADGTVHFTEDHTFDALKLQVSDKRTEEQSRPDQYGARVAFDAQKNSTITVKGSNDLGSLVTIDNNATSGSSNTVTFKAGDPNAALNVGGYLTFSKHAHADFSEVTVNLSTNVIPAYGNINAGGLILGTNDIVFGNVNFEDGTGLNAYGNTDIDAARNLLIADGKTITFEGNNRIYSTGEGTVNSLEFEASGDKANVVVANGANLAVLQNVILSDGVTFTNNGTVDLAKDLTVESGSVFQNGAVTVGKADQEAALEVDINVASGGQFNVDSLTVVGAKDSGSTVNFDNKHDTTAENNTANIADMGVNAYVGELTVGANGIVNVSGSTNGSGAMNVSLAAGSFDLTKGGQLNVASGGTFEVHGDANGNYTLIQDIISADKADGKVNVESGGRFKAEYVTFTGESIETAGTLQFNTLTSSKDITLRQDGTLYIESELNANTTLDDFSLNLRGDNGGTVNGKINVGSESSGGELYVTKGDWTVNDTVTIAHADSVLNVSGGNLTVAGLDVSEAGSDAITIEDGKALVVNGNLDLQTTTAFSGNGTLGIKGTAQISKDNAIDFAIVADNAVFSGTLETQNGYETLTLNNTQKITVTEGFTAPEDTQAVLVGTGGLQLGYESEDNKYNAVLSQNFEGKDGAWNGNTDETHSGDKLASVVTGDSSGDFIIQSGYWNLSDVVTQAGNFDVNGGDTHIDSIQTSGAGTVDVFSGNIKVADVTLSGAGMTIAGFDSTDNGRGEVTITGELNFAGDQTVTVNENGVLEFVSGATIIGDHTSGGIAVSGGVVNADKELFVSGDGTFKDYIAASSEGYLNLKTTGEYTLDEIKNYNASGNGVLVSLTGGSLKDDITDENVTSGSFATSEKGLTADADVTLGASGAQNVALKDVNMAKGDGTYNKLTIGSSNNATLTVIGDVNADVEVAASSELKLQDFSGEGQGAGTVAGDITGSGTVTTAGKYNAQDITIGTLAVAGGSLTAKAVEIASGASIDNGAVLNVESLKGASGRNITVGSENGNGYLVANKVDLNGGNLLLDPEWGNPSTVVIVEKFDDGTSQSNPDAMAVNGNIGVGRNSMLTVGTKDTSALDAAIEYVNKYYAEENGTEAFEGLNKNGINAAMYLNGALKIAADKAIVIDGAKTNTDFKGNGYFNDSGNNATNYQDKLEVASGGLLAVNGAGFIVDKIDVGTEAVINFADSGSGSVNIASGSTVLVTNAKVGEMIFADGVSGGGFTSGGTFLADSKLFNVTAKDETSSSNQIQLEIGKKDAETVYGQGTINSTVSGILDGYTGGNAFLDKVTSHGLDLTGSEVQTAVEGAAKAPMAVGAPQTALNIATMGADYAMARTSFAPRVAGAAAVAENGEYTNISAGDNMANGMNLWIMPMYQNVKADGFQSGTYQIAYDSDFYGVAVGADYTWANSFRLGATINMGSGSADSTGAFAKTENDYDSLGFGVYAGYMLGNLGLSADVNYTNVSNEITQSNVMALSAEGDTDIWSVGARAEYKIATNVMDVIPHIGIRYSHISMDDMNFGFFNAEADSANVWQLPVGVTFAKDFATESGWNVKPSLDLAVIPAFGDTDMVQKARFVGSDYLAHMESEIMDEVSGRVQVGLEASKGNFYMGLDYAYQGSSNMDSHGVQANFGFKF